MDLVTFVCLTHNVFGVRSALEIAAICNRAIRAISAPHNFVSRPMKMNINKGTQTAHTRYKAALPPFISMIWPQNIQPYRPLDGSLGSTFGTPTLPLLVRKPRTCPTTSPMCTLHLGAEGCIGRLQLTMGREITTSLIQRQFQPCKLIM